MTARVVNFCHTVAMVGADHHNGLYYCNIYTGLSPGPPLPPMPYPPGNGLDPFTFHLVYMTSAGAQFGAFLKTDKKNPTVIANGLGPILSRNHECRGNHIPPGGNILLPFTQWFASTKWFMGVASVIAQSGPVASTMKDSLGQNLNCADPCSVPFTNVMYAPGTVEVTPTPQDQAQAYLEWAVGAAVELGVSFGFSWLGNYAKPLINRIPWGKFLRFGAPDPKLDAAKKAAGDAVRDVINREGRDEVVQQVLEKEGREAAKAAEKAIIEGTDQAFEAEKKAAIDAAEKEAGRLIAEEGMTPEDAAREAARKAAQDHFERTSKPSAGRLESGTEKAVKERADEAAQSAADKYKAGPKEAAETVPGAVWDGSGDKVKQEAGDRTEAEQDWAVEEGKEAISGSDE